MREITGGKGVPVVYDSIGKDTFLAGLDCLQPRGIMVTYGNASGPVDPFSPSILASKGSLFVTRPTLAHYTRTAAELQDLRRRSVPGDRIRRGEGRDQPALRAEGRGQGA